MSWSDDFADRSRESLVAEIKFAREIITDLRNQIKRLEDAPKSTRPESSRLVIAAMLFAETWKDCKGPFSTELKNAFHAADCLISASTKEEK
jgi:hypothetical protein